MTLGRLPLFVSVVLGLIILRTVASTAMSIAHGARSAGAPTAAAVPTRMDVAALVRSHLFGLAPSVQDPDARAHPTEVAAAFKLWGTFAYDGNASQGYVILGSSDKNMQLFSAGTDVSRGWRLMQVFKDYIVLARGGAQMRVELPHTWSGLAGAGPAAQPIALAAVPDTEALDPSASNPHNYPAEQFWMNQLRARAVRSGTAVTGYKLFPGKGFAKQYGLMRGDIVTKIDGVALNGYATVDKQLLQLGDSVALTVVRDGVAQTINLNISQADTPESAAD